MQTTMNPCIQSPFQVIETKNGDKYLRVKRMIPVLIFAMLGVWTTSPLWETESSNLLEMISDSRSWKHSAFTKQQLKRVREWRGIFEQQVQHYLRTALPSTATNSLNKMDPFSSYPSTIHHPPSTIFLRPSSPRITQIQKQSEHSQIAYQEIFVETSAKSLGITVSPYTTDHSTCQRQCI